MQKENKAVIHQASSPRHVVGDLPLARRYQTQGVFSYLTNNTQKGDSRQKHSGMTTLFSGRAFTLIELLVVVLIIGILSAIALPQYTLAVEKSRAAEALQNSSQLRKAIDLYLLTNGWPTSGYIDFLGNSANGHGVLDIDLESSLDCSQREGYACGSKYFTYAVSCYSAGYCELDIKRKQNGNYDNDSEYEMQWYTDKSWGYWEFNDCSGNADWADKICKQLQN